MDNLFSNVKLFDLMRKRGVSRSDTTQSSTSGFPAEVKVCGGADKKMDWDTLGAVVVKEELTSKDVLAVIWTDNGAVQFLTAGFDIGP